MNTDSKINMRPETPQGAGSDTSRVSNGVKLLIVTQVVDDQNPVLGFVCRWVEAFALHVQTIEVICLYEGSHTLPANVRVHSLGKEKGNRSAIVYGIRFLSLVWSLRHSYDRVLVHMNQEYVLLVGVLWKYLGKPVSLWRNHYSGTVLTDIAAVFCRKVFCTSAHSYTARYAKTIRMPVGVDTERFSVNHSVRREPHSILFFSRIAPSKRPDLFIEALGILVSKGTSFTASVYGSPRPEDAAYYESLKARAEELGLHGRVRFYPGVAPEKAPFVFQSHVLSVNCSPSGMLDKTIFEAASSGTIPVFSSEDLRHVEDGAYWFTPEHAGSLADRLAFLLAEPEAHSEERRRRLVQFVAEEHSLSVLAPRLMAALG